MEDNHRWYLCMETSPLKWNCVRTTMKEALECYLLGRSTKAIPISTWVPKLADPFILHKAVHPKLAITM
jgi:hypothetical protein